MLISGFGIAMSLPGSMPTPEGRRRTDYIRIAIRIGVLALQQAQGRIDTESVRNEGDRLIAALESRLAQ
jgi:hypothetical protein